MYGSIRILTLSLLAIAGQSHAAAGPDAGTFTKGPFACFAEVCLGDRIEDLSELPLVAAPPLGPPNNPGDREAREKFPAAHRDVLGFWDASLYRTIYEQRFDSTFISIAPQYAGFCPQQLERSKHYRMGSFKLTGAYKTDSGLVTEVVVDLNPDVTDPSFPARFYVAELKRTVPVADSEEGARVVRSVNERYTAYLQQSQPKSVVRAMFVSSWGPPRVEIKITPTHHATFGGYNADWKRVANSARCSTSATPGID